MKIAEYDDKSSLQTLLLAGFPALLFAMLSPFLEFGYVVLIVAVVAGILGTSVLGVRFNRMARERNDFRLGFDGERYVAEELNRTIRLGYEVYHDVPFDGFNIDHVLVGPGGVYAIETKTRRKPKSDKAGKEYRVTFDGSKLNWPRGWDTHGIEQAIRNAKSLGDWLSSAVGEPVSATAILTLPGWMVERKAPATRVHVLNAKEIIQVVDTKETKLMETMIRRICHQMDQKCRIEAA